MKSLKSITTHLILFTLIISGAVAQSADAQARKVYEFSNTHADNAMAYLEVLAKALSESPKARGYIIGYSEKNSSPGLLLRKLYGYRNYLINNRGIEPGRILVITGGNRDGAATELWLAPDGASAPEPISELKIAPQSPLEFDTAYPDCASEFSIYLEELEDSLRFYAQALRENPNTRSRIIVYPGQRSRLSRAAKIARDTRSSLIRNHGISADRIVAQARNRRRECTEVELWIVPVGTVPPMATHNNLFNQTPR